MKMSFWQGAAIAWLCLAAWSPRPAAAQLYAYPEQLTPLQLDKAGSHNWSATVTGLAPVGGIVWPGQGLSLDFVIDNRDAAPAAGGAAPTGGAPILEIVRVDSRYVGPAPARGDAQMGGTIARTVPLGPPVRITLGGAALAPGQNVLHWQMGEPLHDFAAYGLYCVILEVPGRGRQGVASFARVLPPRALPPGSRNSPFIYSLNYWWTWGAQQLDVVSRLGYKWVRTDSFPSWNGAVKSDDPLGPFDWTEYDKMMAQYRRTGLSIISNMYGSPTAAVSDANARVYNMVQSPQFDARNGEYVEAAVRRYCGADGQGPLQIIDYQNEPWEGGGVSGWKSDSRRYVELYKMVYDSAHRGSSHIIVGGTSSIMNTTDKFFSRPDWQKHYKFDVLTDHCAMPYATWGPREARRLGIFSIDTQTWLGTTPELLGAVATQFMAAGQRMINPTHPTQLLWQSGDLQRGALMCRPTAAAAATFLHFVNGRDFAGVVFKDNLPWVYQYGSGRDAAFVVAGDRSQLSAGAVTQYDQIRADGTLALGTLSGKLHAYDTYGNEYAPVAGRLTIPCNSASVFIEAPGVQAARVVKELSRARLAGVKPVEIFAEDFTAPVAQAGEVAVTLHNVLNRRIGGTLLLVPPPEIKLTAPALRVNLAAGAEVRLHFKIASARPNTANAYRFGYSFTGPDGGAQLDETIHAAVIARGTPRLDGELAGWGGATPVTVYGGPNASRLRKRAWRPWEQNEDIAAGMAEVRFMYDDKFLYVAARERNRGWRPKPRLTTRDDDALFGKDDMAQTYIGDAYAAVAGRGNCLQLMLGLGLHQRGLPAASWAPARMLADDDTDYEYDIWGAPDGSTELARTMAPQLGFFNFLPRCEPVGYNPVPAGATALVRRAGDDVIYQAAIPLADIKGLTAHPGATVKLGFRLPDSGIDEGAGRSRTRANSLSALPTWEAGASNELVWGFGP